MGAMAAHETTQTGAVTTVSAPNAAPARAARPRSAAGKTAAALTAAAGAGLVLMSADRDWAHGTITAPVRLAVDAAGSTVTGVPFALGLAAMAGAVALFAVRRIGRYAVGAILLCTGAGAAAEVIGHLGHLDRALIAQATAQSLGTTAVQVSGIGQTAWPYLTALGGLLIAASGAYTLARGHEWSGLSTRYEVPRADGAEAAAAPGAGQPPAEPSHRDLWDAIGRGADPTA
jgi:uncharacterized membrane protein (TIGR02234 family)